MQCRFFLVLCQRKHSSGCQSSFIIDYLKVNLCVKLNSEFTVFFFYFKSLRRKEIFGCETGTVLHNKETIYYIKAAINAVPDEG